MTQSNPVDAGETTAVLQLNRFFKAPRETVFRAWTDPEALAAWFGPEGVRARNVEVDPRPGGRFSLEMYETDGIYPLSGTFREVSPPERLVLSWVWGSGELEGLESVVTVELREKDGGTELTLTHAGLPTDRARVMHGHGWTGSFNCLEQFLAGEPVQ